MSMTVMLPCTLSSKNEQRREPAVLSATTASIPSGHAVRFWHVSYSRRQRESATHASSEPRVTMLVLDGKWLPTQGQIIRSRKASSWRNADPLKHVTVPGYQTIWLLALSSHSFPQQDWSWNEVAPNAAVDKVVRTLRKKESDSEERKEKVGANQKKYRSEGTNLIPDHLELNAQQTFARWRE